MFDEQMHITMHRAQSASYRSLRIVDENLPFWVLSHVREGRVHTSTGGAAQTIGPGTVMVHPPRVPFSETADGPGLHEVLFLDATVSAGVDLLRLHPVALAVRLTQPEAWSQQFVELLRVEETRRLTAFSLTAFSLTAWLLSTVVDDWRAAGAVPRPPSLETPADRFAGLVHFMTEHLSERIGRDDLAARACLHPGSLNRAFRLAYGVPPMRLLRDLRLTRARQLLETTDDTLDVVAARCGFEDAAYFSRAFHARYGLPPGRHRQAVREGVKSAASRYFSS